MITDQRQDWKLTWRTTGKFDFAAAVRILTALADAGLEPDWHTSTSVSDSFGTAYTVAITATRAEARLAMSLAENTGATATVQPVNQ